MPSSPSQAEPADLPEASLHYRFSISLRIHHPDADPERFTAGLGMTPRRALKAGQPRQTPAGTPLKGTYRNTYWYVNVVSGIYPDLTLDAAIQSVLDRLTQHRDLFHTIRSEGGSVELFIGWFFERQSGDKLTHTILAKCADLQIDLELDVYPPDQPQNVPEVAENLLPLLRDNLGERARRSG
jgi:hypothetical protein